MMQQTISQEKRSKKPNTQWALVWRKLRRNKGAMVGLAVVSIVTFIALTAPLFLDYYGDVIGMNIPNRLQSPSLAYPFGTDELGRNMFIRILWGSRYSLLIGFSSVGVALIIGVSLGAFAGFYGGNTEDLIMRATDIFDAVPGLLLGAVIMASLGAGLNNLILALGLASIPQFVRITRAAVLTVRDQEYVEASWVIGLRAPEIVFRHVLPNCLSPIIVLSTLQVAQNIIAAAAMSFLGLGVPAPNPEWGALLSAGRGFMRTHGYLTLFPGLAIMVVVLALNLLGDGLRDALDPKNNR